MKRDRLAAADQTCDAAIIFFSVWTLASHMAVFSGVGLGTLQVVGLGLAAGVTGVCVWFAGGAPRDGDGAAAARGEGSAHRSEPPGWQRAAVAAMAAACAGAYVAGLPLVQVWLVALALAVALTVRELRDRSLPASATNAEPESSAVAIAVLAALAAVCLVATFVAHRPDADDAFYLNIAVAAVDDPGAPLLANDTLHGVPDVALSLPVYRVHSIELLTAALARLSGRPVLDIAHFVLPAIAALLLPLAYTRLFRLILPGCWLWGTGLAVATLLFAAGPSHGFANFGLVRLHQGKGMMLTLAAPLIAAYAIEFARAPTAARFAKLGAAQVAAVGLSASALWLAPVVAAVSLAVGLDRSSGGWLRSRAWVGLLASTYVVGLALVLRASTEATFGAAASPPPEALFDDAKLAEQAIRAGFGRGPLGAFAFFVALGGWSVATNVTARRYCAFFGLAWLVLWNPLSASWIAAHVTSTPTYWRVLWILPMPVLAALVLTSPLGLLPKHRTAMAAATLALTALVLGFAPSAWTLSEGNHVRLAWPGWKVPGTSFEAAEQVARLARPGAMVLAPRRVASWIPALHDHPFPLVVRSAYLPVLAGALGEEELLRRMALLRLVSGERRAPHAEQLLAAAVAEPTLEAVCVAREAANTFGDIAPILSHANFQKIYENADYEVWGRPVIASALEPE